MPHTHEFDCIVCGAHFDSTEELQRHNEAQHVKKGTGMERPRQEGSTPESGERKEPTEL